MNGLSPVPSGKPNATTGTPLSATRPSRSAQGRAVHNGLSFGRMISASSRWIAVRYAARDAAARTGWRARLARRTTTPSIANRGTTSQADAVSERRRGWAVPAAAPRRGGALPPCGGDRGRKDGGPRKEAEREIREVIEDGPHVPLVRVTHEASEMVGDDEERHRLCTDLSRDRQDPHGHEAGHHRD